MKQKLVRKILSLILVAALLTGALGLCNFMAFAYPSDWPDLQSLAEAEGITVTNETDRSGLETALMGVSLPQGYSVECITSFFKLEAQNGAIEQGSTYAGAVDGTVLVEGEIGYVAATVRLSNGNHTDETAVLFYIQPQMDSYAFTSVSTDADWTVENGVGTYKGANKRQKVVVPDSVTSLANNWNSSSKGVYCIIYGSGITKIPLQAQMGRLKVVGFRGNIKEIADSAFAYAKKLEHIRLPDSATKIGSKAFDNCSSLKQFRMPTSLKEIGSNLFYSDVSSTPYVFSSLEIPATVKTISDNAFIGAGSACDLYLFGDSDGYSASMLGGSDKITLHLNRDSVSDANVICHTDRKIYFEQMSLAEAYVRAKRCIEQYGSITAGSAASAGKQAKTVEQRVRSSFADAEGINTSWEHLFWSHENSSYTNTLILSKDGVSVKLPFVMDETGYYDLQTVVEQNNVKVTNKTTADTLLQSLKQLELNNGITVNRITDFYKINAVDGAVEKGSTYPGAVDGTVLVPGESGYLAASVELTDTKNAVYQATVLFTIEPTMKRFKFRTCSTDADFTYNSADWALRWEYHPVSGQAAEKIVIPDFVTELKDDWHTAWDYNVKENVRCIVYNSHITTIPSGQYNFYAVEVVSIQGDLVSIKGGTTNAAFKDFVSLKYIHLPNTVKSIGQKAFYNCNSLTALTLPEGLETIGNNIFYSGDNENSGYNITALTVPSTVQSIAKGAFTGAKVNCDITVLSRDAVIKEGAFYDGSSHSSKITLRVFRDSTAADDSVTAASKVLLDDTMTLAEATVRMAKTIAERRGALYENLDAVNADSADILEKLTYSYGNISSFDAEWKYDSWQQTENNLNNILVLTQGGKFAELPVNMSVAQEFDLEKVLQENGVVFTGTVTKQSVLQTLKNLKMRDGYSVERISDFYTIDSIEGAIESGSTYKGAVDGEILVPGEKGYFSAVVFVKDPDGKQLVSSLLVDIEPTMQTYSFKTCSTDKDFSWNDEGWAKRWEYHPISGTAAEKIVIPDKVTSLKSDWHQAWQYNVTTNVRCLVYNKNITYIPPAYNFYSLQVVSILGDVTELGTDNANGVFKDCTVLKHLRLPDSLKVIGDRAFYNCPSLTHLYLPEGLEKIGNYLFFENSQSYSVSQITIPSTVNKIGRFSFIGASVPTDITLLSEAEISGTGINANAFYHSAFKAKSSNITLRVVGGSPASTDDLKMIDGQKVSLDDDMTYYEAAVRAKQTADRIGIAECTVTELENTLKMSYGKSNAIRGYWETTVWKQEGEYYTNNWVIAKNGAKFRVPVRCKIVSDDIQKLIENADFVCTNETDEKAFLAKLEEILPGGYDVNSVIQFYKINARNGSALDHTDSSLVPGHSGNIRSIIRLIRFDGEYELIYINQFIPFSVVSVEEDGSPDPTIPDVNENSITLSEAAARATVQAEMMLRKQYLLSVTAEEAAAELTASYKNLPAFSADWKNSWDVLTDAKRFGTLYLSDGTYEHSVKAELNVPPTITLSELVDSVRRVAQTVTVTNYDSKADYQTALEAVIPGRYKVQMIDYYKKRAQDGAKDDTGILVAGVQGRVAAIVRVTDYYGNTADVLVDSPVVPVLEEYHFASTSVADDFVLSDDGSVLLEYYGTAEKMVVPDGVKSISDGWMWKNPSNIKALILPDSMRNLPDNMCYGMTALEVLSMGDNVVKIGSAAFSDCYALKYFYLSQSIEEISDSMLKNTYSLIDVRIPDSVLKIQKNAFYGSAVRDVVIPADTLLVGSQAFSKILGSESLVGTTDCPVADNAKVTVISWLEKNKLSEIPMTITFMGGDNLIVSEDSFVSISKYSPLYHVRAKTECPAYGITAKLLEGGGTAAERWALEEIDMPLVEAVTRVQTKATGMMFFNDSTAVLTQQELERSFISSHVKDNAKWTAAFELKQATVSKKGAVSGALTFTDNTENHSFTVRLNSAVYAQHPSTEEELGDYWSDDFFNEDEIGDDLENTVTEQSSIINNNNSVKNDTPVLEIDPAETDDPAETVTTDGKNNKKKIRRVVVEEDYTWIWFAAAGVVAATGITIIILVWLKKKKKRKSTVKD